MKTKRLLVLLLAFSMLFTASVFAESIWGTFDGYSKAKIYINNEELIIPEGEVPALVVDGRTMLPLRYLAESLQAIVKWDSSNQTAKIYKPDVHIFVAQDVEGKDYSLKRPFGKVDAGKTMNFVVFSQVDNLKMNVNGFSISITAPSGKLATETVEVPLTKVEESFWYPWPFKVNFEEKGNYTVNFSFLSEGEYTVVSQKVIRSE